jgi:hypothetical protein
MNSDVIIYEADEGQGDEEVKGRALLFILVSFIIQLIFSMRRTQHAK